MNVAFLRQLYCLMAERNLEPELLGNAPLTLASCFFSRWGQGKFCVEIFFSEPALDSVRSAKLKIFWPTHALKHRPGDVFAEFQARDEKGNNSLVSMFLYLQPDPVGLTEREDEDRNMLCRWLIELMEEYFTEARTVLGCDVQIRTVTT